MPFHHTDDIHNYGCFVQPPNLSSHDNQPGWLQPTGDLPLCLYSFTNLQTSISDLFWHTSDPSLLKVCISIYFFLLILRFTIYFCTYFQFLSLCLHISYLCPFQMAFGKFSFQSCVFQTLFIPHSLTHALIYR